MFLRKLNNRPFTKLQEMPLPMQVSLIFLFQRTEVVCKTTCINSFQANRNDLEIFSHIVEKELTKHEIRTEMEPSAIDSRYYHQSHVF